jgi:hypothetical protein
MKKEENPAWWKLHVEEDPPGRGGTPRCPYGIHRAYKTIQIDTNEGI